MKVKKISVKSGEDISEKLQLEIDAEANNQLKIIIPSGKYVISKTIKILNDTIIEGDLKRGVVELFLADKTNNNMFTNRDHKNGNKNIEIRNLVIKGNSANQFKPKEEKRLSYCNFFYFKNAQNIILHDIKGYDCKQTVMHFNNCYNVDINNLYCNEMGWSGISTSGTDNIVAKNVHVIDTGKETMHSAIHFDGGVGSYLNCKIEKCTGNGVMLDSKYSPLSKAVVEANCTDCFRGISLSGDHTNLLSNVLIKATTSSHNDIGIMVSNSEHVFIDDCILTDNNEVGVLLQGKFGGNEVVIHSSTFSNNTEDIKEIHQSVKNYFVNNNVPNQSIYFSLKEKEEKKSIKEIVDNYIDNCSVCGESSHFVYHGGSVRESYRCEGCDASLRHRGQCQSILDLYGDGEKSFKELSSNKKFRKLNIFEPGIIGPLRKYFNGFKNYKQSYYWEDIPFGDSKDGVINQDLQNLTLEDNSVDLIITADIFEHIRKPSLAFNEIFRVLKQGGRHIFTIPVQFPLPSKTIFRVDTSTSEDIHILPERYHIAGDGGKSLVYTDFGKDMLDELEEIGLHTEVIFLDETNDHRKKNITFVSTKG